MPLTPPTAILAVSDADFDSKWGVWRAPASSAQPTAKRSWPRWSRTSRNRRESSPAPAGEPFP